MLPTSLFGFVMSAPVSFILLTVHAR
jgi:hypothetical protein